jgi:HWE histidine kinase
MWAALRRNQRDTATTALLLSCFAVWGTESNHGPFVGGSLNESFLLLLTFMISVSVPSLALSADLAVRRRHEEHIHFVMRELSHRSKNILSVVQSMATQVARQTDSFDDFVLGFSRRLCAFAETHDLLVAAEWQGVEIRELVRVHLAVCLLPGTEIVFDENVECESSFGTGILRNKKIGQRLARFRQVNMNYAVAHHDALEFPDGQVVLVTRLCDGQRATVLQLPAGARVATAEGTVVEPQLRESSLSS